MVTDFKTRFTPQVGDRVQCRREPHVRGTGTVVQLGKDEYHTPLALVRWDRARYGSALESWKRASALKPAEVA